MVKILSRYGKKFIVEVTEDQLEELEDLEDIKTVKKLKFVPLNQEEINELLVNIKK